jgi:hypothetical protein
MNVALCTFFWTKFFCAQRHIHTLSRALGAATGDADVEKGAPGAGPPRPSPVMEQRAQVDDFRPEVNRIAMRYVV